MIADQGVFWPDEIYQSIEQAHRLVFGYGMVPWEFRDGARSWVFPGLLAGAIKFATWFGARTGPDVVHAAKGLMVILAVWGVIATMKLANNLGGRNAAFLAGVWYALYPASIVYGSRCMSEMASAPVLATAAWLALDGKNKKREFGFAAGGGAVAALAIYLRYQNGLIGVGLFLTLLARRRWWDLLYFSVAAFVVGMLGGWLDKLTWGDWFHSFFVYWKFNVVEGKASKWGVAEASYYATTVWTSTGWVLILIGVGFLLSLRRAAILMLTLCLFTAALVNTPHKEYRFVMPMVPLVLALSAAGLAWIIEKIPGNLRGASRAGCARIQARHDHVLRHGCILRCRDGKKSAVASRGRTEPRVLGSRSARRFVRHGNERHGAHLERRLQLPPQKRSVRFRR
jgi:hypothetical protein